MQSIYIGRQPIIDSESNLCAYEVLYKGSDEARDRYSSASIINNVLNKFGTETLLGDRRAFIKISQKFLLHDIIFSIPSKFFIFSILPDVEMNERVVERIEQLHDRGYLLSLDGYLSSDENLAKYESVLDCIEFIKINFQKSKNEKLKEQIVKLKSYTITIIADDVTDNTTYEEAKLFGCDWFQGYFFAEPKIIKNEKHEPSNIAVLKLYNLLMQDVNIDEITKEFENNHEITVQLLQFINSGAFHFKNKISTIHHVLMLVGRIPLGQWLMLMIYSKSVSRDGRTPLMLMVKHRTELMENISKLKDPNIRSNMLGEAYFVGVLSLIDTVFGVELETVLKQLNISEEVRDALLEDKGGLGEIFALIKDIEAFKTDSLFHFEEKYHLPSGSIEKLTMDCMKSLNKFEHLLPSC